MDKYLKALENSSIKDFTALIKKIDDEEERKEVMRYIKEKTGKKVARKGELTP